jgi:hypothetical protein
VLKYILIDNGNEWMKEFVEMCQSYGIIHQFIALAWLQCNDMVECLIKTIKQGLTIMVALDIQCWDILLPHILFGYCCGVQASTKYSPFVVLIKRIPRLTIDNNLNNLCDMFDEHVRPEVMAK